MHAGDTIRQQRQALGLSLRELGKLAAVAHSDLSRVETGQMPPSPALAAKVCRVLGLKVADLYADAGEDGTEPPAEDMVQQIRAILIRGRWPPLARDQEQGHAVVAEPALLGLVEATEPPVDGLRPAGDAGR